MPSPFPDSPELPPAAKSSIDRVLNAAAIRLAEQGAGARRVIEGVVDLYGRMEESVAEWRAADHEARAHEAEFQSAVIALAANAGNAVQPEADGPIPPDGFRRNGRETHDLQPLLWRLLNELWRARRMKVEDVADRVWRESSVSDSAIRSAVSRLSTALIDFGVTVRVKSGYVELSAA